MPALDNPRWEQFAQWIVAGEGQAKSYSLAFGNEHDSVRVSASDLIRNPIVASRISELRKLGLGSSPVLTLQEKRAFLRSVVTTPAGHIDENSPLANSVKRRRDADGNETVEVEMPSKLKALELDAKLAGELQAGGAPTIRISMYGQGEVQVEAIEVGAEVERIAEESA